MPKIPTYPATDPEPDDVAPLTRPSTSSTSGQTMSYAPMHRRLRILGADFPTTSADLVDLEGFEMHVKPHQFLWFRAAILWSGSTASEGIEIAINGPGTPEEMGVDVYSHGGVGSIARGQGWNLTDGYDAQKMVQSSGTTIRMNCVMSGLIKNGATEGDIVPRIAAETGGTNTLTVLRGSWLEWEIRNEVEVTT